MRYKVSWCAWVRGKRSIDPSSWNCAVIDEQKEKNNCFQTPINLCFNA